MRIAREGFRYIGVLSLLGVAVLAFPATRLLAVPLFVLAGFVTYFFRDPTRVPPDDEKLLVSPGDGKVVYTGPGERDPSRAQVSIFLSIFDVHINRSPLAAVVRKIQYTPGQFLPPTSRRRVPRTSRTRSSSPTVSSRLRYDKSLESSPDASFALSTRTTGSSAGSVSGSFSSARGWKSYFRAIRSFVSR